MEGDTLSVRMDAHVAKGFSRTELSRFAAFRGYAPKFKFFVPLKPLPEENVLAVRHPGDTDRPKSLRFIELEQFPGLPTRSGKNF
jgi:hypothetical protein